MSLGYFLRAILPYLNGKAGNHAVFEAMGRARATAPRASLEPGGESPGRDRSRSGTIPKGEP